MVARRDANVALTPLMDETDLHRVLVEWNNTSTEIPSDKCVHELVEGQVSLAPDSIAIVQEERTLTYAELNERANQLAHYLQKKGVGPEAVIGICLKRSPELMIALLGVLKAGGACLPLDPEYPRERLAYMLKDSQAAVLLTQSGIVPELASMSHTVLLEPGLEILQGQERTNPRAGATPDNLAYVIYTSGSTGQPRGVLLTHRGLVNHHVAAIQLYGLQQRDRVLQFSSISFDIAIEEIWPTWIAGATLTLRTERMPMGGSEFLRWIGQRQITVLDLPTAYWHEVVRELVESHQNLPESLRLVIVGGEKASAAVYRAWLKSGGERVRWVNTYGPTEVSVIATAYEPDPSKPVPENLPIGRPIANTEMYILDSNSQPVPIGTPGELHIGGPGLARGYLNRPELTAAKFVANPFNGAFGARLYKTGDTARYLPDGNIEFVGRMDFQVKIRGYRVELGEIEDVLENCAGVRECVVIAREENDEKRLIAYVVPALEQRPAAAELRSSLKKELPEYMIPGDFVFLKALPLTPNGKVDRRELSARTIVAAPENYVGPRDAVESQMVKIWEQVFGRRPIGVRDNFFELGGHSLLAVRLMGKVQKAFGKELLLTSLVQAPTIEQFANLVRTEGSSAPYSSLIPLQPHGGRTPFFFIHGLGGTVLRFHELARQMAPDQPFYGMEAPGLDGREPCLERVEDMAARYLEQLEAVQPEGPYFLGGYSFGGLVALEMARRLIAQNQKVDLLAMVDTYPAGAAQSTGALMGRFFSLSSQQKVAYLKKRVRRYRKGITRRLDMLRMPLALKNVREACSVAEHHYVATAYPGKIVLLRASEKALRGLDDSHGGWGQYAAAGVEIREIDADHGNILEQPYVRHLAAELRICLDRTQSNAPTPRSSVLPHTGIPKHFSPDQTIQSLNPYAGI
jgi:aspartate racemase